MGKLSLEGAHVIGALAGMATYGLYTCLFFQTCYCLNRTRAYSIMVCISLAVLWVLTTLIAVLQLTGVYEAFVTRNGKIDAYHYFMQWFSGWRFTTIVILTNVTGVLCNVFICWRLYVLWKRSFKILVLCSSLLVTLTVFCGVISSLETKYRAPEQYPAKNAIRYTFIIISIAAKILIMGLMCWKIYRVSKSVSSLSPASDSLYKHTLQILIEGGALYVAIVVVFLLAQCAHQFALTALIAYVIPHVIGLMPTLIVLRLLFRSRLFAPRGATGHDTAPSASQQQTITTPVFAHETMDCRTTHVLETGHSIPLQLYSAASLDNKTSSQSIEKP
ncbi:hypothetical protein FRC03_002508 [Tulasnella sp. 419]|nr:hypothetical protein FRC03_002508 [Tulasnella sp. 419]